MRPSPLARYLQPLAGGLWIGFLLWTMLVGVVWLSGFGEAEAAEWAQRRFLTPDQRAAGQSAPMGETMGSLLRMVDPLWMVLAAANAYLCLVQARGLATARRWALGIFAAAFAIGALSASTNWPLGPIRFTERLGWRLGPVSLGWPLLWVVVLLGARELSQRLFARASHGQIAIATGFLALATDLNLEPIAWKVRVFWLWYPARLPTPEWPPVQNALTWLLAAAGIAYLLRAPEVIRAGGPRIPKAAVILLILNALCLATHLARWLAG